MNKSNITEQNKLAELEAAFELFNQTSTQLTHAYESLQLQVEDLQQKLDLSHLEKQKVDERLKQLLNLLPAGVIVLNLDDIVVEMNPVAISILGANAKFKSWNKLVSDVFLTGNDAGTYFTSAQKAYQLSEAPLTLTEGGDCSSMEGKILIIQDVTDARKLQQHIDRHQRLNSLGDMTASLAHQIRTPLASALLYISQLDSEELDDDKRTKFVSKSVNSLRHLENLVKDMLQYAKGGKSFSKPVLIVDLIRLLLQQIEPRVISSNSTFYIISYDLSLEVFGDVDALLTALQNLIMNAIDVVHAQADITLEIVLVNSEPKKIDFKITDKGPGLSDELIAKIYEPFFTSRAQGTGLGLAVVKAVAEAHDGETWAESEAVKGTVFTLRLPAYNTKDEK